MPGDSATPEPRREAPPELRVPRPEEAAPADEMTMARAWLTHLRESAVFKLFESPLSLDQLGKLMSGNARRLIS